MADLNRVKQLYRVGKPAYGTYVSLPAPALVEVAALAGFDFVRLDAYHVAFNPETLENMIRTAYAHGITPWVRCRNDPWIIMTTLDSGAQAITIPNVGSVEAAKAAVNAAFYPQKGERHRAHPALARARRAVSHHRQRLPRLASRLPDGPGAVAREVISGVPGDARSGEGFFGRLALDSLIPHPSPSRGRRGNRFSSERGGESRTSRPR